MFKYIRKTSNICFAGFIIVVVQFTRLLFFLSLQDDGQNEPKHQIKVSLSVLKL